MAKVRVYELAKEFGVESKAVMAKLEEMGEFVRSASSTIEAPVVRRLREAFNGSGGIKSGSVPAGGRGQRRDHGNGQNGFGDWPRGDRPAALPVSRTEHQSPAAASPRDPPEAQETYAGTGRGLVASSSPGNPAAVIEVAIRSGVAPGVFMVEVVHSAAGEASASVRLDLDGLLSQRERLQTAVLVSSVASRRVLPETERPVRDIGRLLFTAALGSGEVSGRYRASAALAAERGQRLRVVLRIDSPELAALPWEAMYDEAVGEYVCRHDQLVRHSGIASAAPPLQVRPPLRILGVASSPRGLRPLDVEKEQERMARALARPMSLGLVELQWAPTATWADLHAMLFDGPWHVVHYIGHGDFDPAREEGFLSLVAEDGRLHNVAAHRLVTLLRQANPMPRLVLQQRDVI